MFYVSIAGSGWVSAGVTLPPSVDLTKWHHYVGTFDGSTVRLYADGVLVASAAVAGSISTTSTNSLFIGYDSPNSGRFGNATIDDVAVYDRALTTQEIQSHYDAAGGGR